MALHSPKERQFRSRRCVALPNGSVRKAMKLWTQAEDFNNFSSVYVLPNRRDVAMEIDISNQGPIAFG